MGSEMCIRDSNQSVKMDIAGVAGSLEVSTGVQFEVEGVELSVTGSSGN